MVHNKAIHSYLSQISMWAHGPQQSHPQLLITDINVSSWSTTKPSTATYHRYQCGLMVHNKAIHSYLSHISMWAHGPQQSHPQLLITDINVGSWSTTKPSTATYHRYFLKLMLENSLSQFVTVVTRTPSHSFLDVITTTNPNLVNCIETCTGISDYLLDTFDNCMKTKYHSHEENNLTFRKLAPIISNLRSSIALMNF